MHSLRRDICRTFQAAPLALKGWKKKQLEGLEGWKWRQPTPNLSKGAFQLLWHQVLSHWCSEQEGEEQSGQGGAVRSPSDKQALNWFVSWLKIEQNGTWTSLWASWSWDYLNIQDCQLINCDINLQNLHLIKLNSPHYGQPKRLIDAPGARVKHFLTTPSEAGSGRKCQCLWCLLFHSQEIFSCLGFLDIYCISRFPCRKSIFVKFPEYPADNKEYLCFLMPEHRNVGECRSKPWNLWRSP